MRTFSWEIKWKHFNDWEYNDRLKHSEALWVVDGLLEPLSEFVFGWVVWQQQDVEASVGCGQSEGKNSKKIEFVEWNFFWHLNIFSTLLFLQDECVISISRNLKIIANNSV